MVLRQVELRPGEIVSQEGRVMMEGEEEGRKRKRQNSGPGQSPQARRVRAGRRCVVGRVVEREVAESYGRTLWRGQGIEGNTGLQIVIQTILVTMQPGMAISKEAFYMATSGPS